jgi:hypothetical protein
LKCKLALLIFPKKKKLLIKDMPISVFLMKKSGEFFYLAMYDFNCDNLDEQKPH